MKLGCSGLNAPLHWQLNPTTETESFIHVLFHLPTFLFSVFFAQIYLANPPVQCQVTVSIGGYQDLFTVRSQPTGIGNITNDQLTELKQQLAESYVSYCSGRPIKTSVKMVVQILLQLEIPFATI